MRSPKIIRFILLIISFVLFIYPLSSIDATEYYALRLIGSDCTLCHNNPKTGTLNQTGILFQKEGYRYPFTWKGWFLSLLVGLVLCLIILGFYRRYRLWHMGRGPVEWRPWKERWKGLLIYGFGHLSILKSPFPGISHFLLFGSLLILSLTITTILVQEYIFVSLFKMRFIDSRTYPYLRLILDFFGVLGCAGTILLAYRRYIQRPKELDLQQTDTLSLVLLLFVLLTGFSLTGIRNQLYQSIWSPWAPMATSMGWMVTKLLTDEAIQKIYFSMLWWIHLFSSLAFLFYIPFSKLFHLFSSPLNIFSRNLMPKGALSLLDLETTETYGVEKIEEFTWKGLLELDACTRCGRCQENCPAHLSQKTLNPKKVIQSLKRYMESLSKGMKNVELIKGVVTEEEIWDCTTCRNCLEHCPVFIEPMIKLIDFRRNLALNHGKIPKETHFAFRNIERKGNPWGFDPEKRMWWTKEMGIREVSPGEEVDVLYWIGCYASYDDQNIKVATSLIHVLKKAGIAFGVLGNKEWCCGIDLRRMGSEHLFQIHVKKNIELLQQVKFKTILTTCPHCFNTLKNEYPQLGGQWEVIHYSSLLDGLIQKGKISLKMKDRNTKITYHDSCYLGRYNNGYHPPRRILRAMHDLTFVEMKRHREKGFCCGGGGCHMWMEERVGKRINQMRIEQAVETGSEILATVCPLCLISLDSAVKVLNLDERIHVMDILSLVGERMEP